MLLTHYQPKTIPRLRTLDYLPIISPVSAQILWFNSSSSEDIPYINCRPHRHTYYEAHFSVENRSAYHFPDREETLTLEEGYGVLIAPNVPHYLQKKDAAAIRVSLSFVPGENEPFIPELAKQPFSVFPLSDIMLAAIDGVLAESEKNDGFSPELIRDHLSSLLCEVIRSFGVSPHAKERTADADNNRVDFIKRYITDNPHMFLTCREVAAQFHFNPQYLDRLFKEETGNTLLTFIHEEKIRQAKKLLETTTLSVSAISSCLGFGNSYYFSTFFKRCTGITPSEYRGALPLPPKKR